MGLPSHKKGRISSETMLNLAPTIDKFIDDGHWAENWFKDSRSPWYIDKNERIYSGWKQTTPEHWRTKLSTIFYCNVKDMQAHQGRLRLMDEENRITKNWTPDPDDIRWNKRKKYQMHIRPVPNRLIIFSPGIWHAVEGFEGSIERGSKPGEPVRQSLLLNFWSDKICS